MELSRTAKAGASRAPVRCFLLDMDGTFYLGNQLLEGSLDFFIRPGRNGTDRVFLDQQLFQIRPGI